MRPDCQAILRLSTNATNVLEKARSFERDLCFQALPRLRIAVLGSAESGKITLVHALLGIANGAFPGLEERPGRGPPVPIEYHYGVTPRLFRSIEEKAGGPVPWEEHAAQDESVFELPRLQRLRVEVPAAVLLSWCIELCVYPSIETGGELAKECFADLWDPDLGVLYVLPTRGMTDADAQVLDPLRRQHVVILQSVAEEDLHPTRSPLGLTERPGHTCPCVCPLVTRRLQRNARNQQSLELKLIQGCVAILRTAALQPNYLTNLRLQIRSGITELRSDLTKRQNELFAMRSQRELAQRLKALVFAVALERDAKRLQPLDQMLQTLLHEADESSACTLEVQRHHVRSTALAIIDHYNLEAGRRSVDAEQPAAEPIFDFGKKLIQDRVSLLSFLRNIFAETERLDFLSAELLSLRALESSVRDERAELALLGRFSSGKSSLINALMGLQNNDRKVSLLPTSISTETATVNRVEYAEDTRLNDVSWHKHTELTFLSETEMPGQLHVHRQEVWAFEKWLTDREVDSKDCSFQSAFMTGTLSSLARVKQTQKAAMTGFAVLCQHMGKDINDFCYSQNEFATPKIPTHPCPAGVEVEGFLTPQPRRWDSRLQLHAALELIKKDPAIALRIKTVHVGYNHPLLKHVSIIDTPGTDSPIPHHRKVARELIRDKGCPVIYCFPSVSAYGIMDHQNLTLLKQWGIGKATSRFFFVITGRGRCEDEQHAQEVEQFVRQSLADIGIQPTRLYFTEVLKSHNDDFNALKTDIDNFVKKNRLPLFLSWVSSVLGILRSVTSRHDSRLQSLNAGEKTRKERAVQLSAGAATLQEISIEFERSKEWGAPWVQSRIEAKVQDHFSEFDLLFEQLQQKEDFENIEASLAQEFDALNDAARNLLRSVCEAVTGKLKSKVAKSLHEHSITVPLADPTDALFSSAETLDAVKSLSWPPWYKRIFQSATTQRETLEANKEKLARPWRTARTAGRSALGKAVDRTLDDLRQELKRITQTINTELAECERAASPELIKAVTQSHQCAAAWLRRLEALERDFQNEGVQ